MWDDDRWRPKADESEVSSWESRRGARLDTDLLARCYCGCLVCFQCSGHEKGRSGICDCEHGKEAGREVTDGGVWFWPPGSIRPSAPG